MLTRHHPLTCSGNRDGVALVIVLAFIVLTSILIISFIGFSQSNHSSTFSYVKAIQAQEVAQGGLQDILSDLHQEIVAGSTSTNTGTTTLYLPITNWTAMPARIGYASSSYGTDVSTTNLPPSLIRVSRASQDETSTDFYPTLTSSYYTNGTIPMNRASAANTGTSSFNGRSISASRWNKIEMLSTNSTIPPFFATNMPDWVYVTRSGSRACTTNDLFSTTASIKPSANLTTTNSVIGRYAYVVYDEGALLDLNVTGYLNNELAYNTSGQSTIGGKGILACADMLQLPGFSSGTTYQNVVDAFVKWRNASAGLSSGSTANIQTNYLAAVSVNATNGFLAFSSSTNGIDSPLVGRQDLINYFANIDPNFNTASPTYSAALPYLGTFSRAVTAPVWKPSFNATDMGAANNGANNSYAYRNNAESSTITPTDGTTTSNPNHDTLTVRFANDGTVTHYNDDGTTTTYTVQSGDQQVQRRFSLAKLAWLGHTGPNASNFNSSVSTAQQNQAIHDCFGLAWDSTYSCWDYDHTDNNSATPLNRSVNSIDTLSQVAALSAPREADFFELLKAGILNGSLGGNPGPVAGSLSSVASGPAGSNFDYYSSETDRHVRQIGVNIIDQSTSNNYPTAIYQNLDATVVPPYGEEGLFNTVFGAKNLPTIQRLWVVTYKTDGLSTPGYEDFWIQPEVWNPNISSTASTTTYPNTPTHLRLVTFGGCAITTSENNADSGTGQVATISRTDGPLTTNFGTNPLSPLTAGIVNFINPQIVSTKPSGPPDPFFDSPAVLNGYGSSTYSNYQDTTPGGPNNFMWYNQTSNQGTGRARLLGVWLGQLPRDPTTYPTHTVSVSPIESPGEPQLTFVLEYQDSNGNWLPYSMMARLQEINTPPYDYVENLGYITVFNTFAAAHPDPRTDRFSAFSGKFNSSGTTYNYMWNTNETIRPSNYTTSTQAGGRGGVSCLMPNASAGFTVNLAAATSPPWPAYLLDEWENNVVGAGLNSYQDPDGVTRQGDGANANYAGSATNPGTTSTLSSPWYTSGGDGAITYQASYNGSAATQYGKARPVIMNRPYLSVGELGFVFRDQPFKTLDFWSIYSADSGLLDLFSAVDEPTLVAGEITSNTPARALQAILSGAMKQRNASITTGAALPPSPVFSASTEGSAVAQAICTELATNGPLNSRADLVNRFSSPVAKALVSDTSNLNKMYGETYVRALAPTTNTRTWNLLIDIIAQSGHMVPTAQTLNDFVVDGEKRYWLHVAIDRYTSKIVDQQLEPVYE